MWAVVEMSWGSSSGTLIVFGPFTSLQAAQAFRATRMYPGNYYVTQVFSAPPGNPPGNVAPVNFAAGNVVVCLETFSATSDTRYIVYGVFADTGAAHAFIAGRPMPSGYSVRTVQAPPA